MRPKRERSPEDEVEIADLCPSCLAICHIKDMRMPFTCEHKICKECCPRLSPPKCPLCRAQSVFVLTAIRPAAAVAAPPAAQHAFAGRPTNRVEMTRQIFAHTAALRPEVPQEIVDPRSAERVAGRPWQWPPPRPWQVMFVFVVDSPVDTAEGGRPDIRYSPANVYANDNMARELEVQKRLYLEMCRPSDRHLFCHIAGDNLRSGETNLQTRPRWNDITDNMNAFEGVQWSRFWAQESFNKVVVFTLGQPCERDITSVLVGLGELELRGDGDDDELGID